MWTFIFLVVAVFFAIGCFKWKVSTLALIYYMGGKTGTRFQVKKSWKSAPAL